jgi:tyrosine-protein phosphatase SIW14
MMIHRKFKLYIQLVTFAIVIFLTFITFENSIVREIAAENKASDLLKSSGTNGAIAVLPENAHISERIFGLTGLSNVGRVSSSIYRGTQPQPEGYATLKKMGIKTIINLRTRHSEKKTVEKAGMRSIEIPLSVLKDININTVNRIIDIMTDPKNQPVYIHCRLGQDRTGIVIAAYRMRVDGLSLKDAEAEMQAFGFNNLWHELKEFVREYAKSLGK